MRLRRLLFFVAILLILLIGYRSASAFMVAKAIAPPNASRASIFRLAVHPSFQTATPHRNLLMEIKLDLIPSAEACTPPNCDGTEAKASCNGCPPGYCHCPGCQISGCTPYDCTVTGNNHKKCQYSTNGNPNDPCYTCETDYNVSCNPIPP